MYFDWITSFVRKFFKRKPKGKSSTWIFVSWFAWNGVENYLFNSTSPPFKKESMHV